MGGCSRSIAMKKRYVPVVGPRLKKLLFVVLGLFALLAVNSAYMVSVTALEAATGRTYQNWFYLVMFLLHLVLGAAIVVPVLVFGVTHIWNAINRPNRRAVVAGLALFATTLVLLVTGILLTRIEGVIAIKDPAVRARPLLGARHRAAGGGLALRPAPPGGPPHQVEGGAALGRGGGGVRGAAADRPGPGSAALERRGTRERRALLLPVARAHRDRRLHPGARCSPTPRTARSATPTCTTPGRRASTASARSTTRPTSSACARRARSRWSATATCRPSRWCAGCHDPVSFFSGKFDDPNFDDAERPDGPGRHHLHRLPRDHARQQPARQRRLHHRGADPLSVRLQRERDAALDQPPAGQGQARVPQEDLPQAACTRRPSSAPPATRSTCRSS